MNRILSGIVLMIAVSGAAWGDERKKLFPEIADPVLGDQAAIAEWAWSPQYAKRFGLPVQEDGLQDGPVWIVGVRVTRRQYANGQQDYDCRIIGLIDNKAPVIFPPGERYVDTGWPFAGSRKTREDLISLKVGEQNIFIPAQEAWYRSPLTERQKAYPEDGIGTRYRAFHRQYLPGLAYFELGSGCAHFRDPVRLRNELRFPTINKIAAVFEASALVVNLPDSLMKKIYPITQEADAWGGCFLQRMGNKGSLPLWAIRRFKGKCEPVSGVNINR